MTSKGNYSEEKTENKTKTITGVMNKEKILNLTEETLKYIDEKGEILKCFKEKINSGKIIFYDSRNNEQKEEILRNIKESETKAKIEKECAFYKTITDTCYIPLSHNILDIITIVHEFIHQFHYNQKKVGDYEVEIPSIYFETIAMEYLLKNGYSQYKDTFKNWIMHRCVINANNNEVTCKEMVELINTKIFRGAITSDNILSNKAATKMNNDDKNIFGPDYSIDETKKGFALRRIMSLLSKDATITNDDINMISYSLGTYVAIKFRHNNIIRGKMMELLKNPQYNVQMLLEDIEYFEKGMEKSITKHNVETVLEQ